MFYDSHVHSEASPDSEMKAEEAVVAAKKLGLGVVFTEHVDFGEFGDYMNEKDPHAADFVRGMGDFICDFGKLRRVDGALFGLEFGLVKAFAGAYKRLAAEGDYDFIIGSVHSVDGVELYNASNKCEGFMDSEFAQGLHDSRGVDACIARYLEYAREVVEVSEFFDSFGHIDYVARYAPLVQDRFSYTRFAKEIDALLKLLAERQIALEINSARFGRDCDAENVMSEICGAFARLGGRYCTVGSDAHVVGRVGYHFDTARRIADEAGLKIVHFRERTMIT